jgi:hypothetical protein
MPRDYRYSDELLFNLRIVQCLIMHQILPAVLCMLFSSMVSANSEIGSGNTPDSTAHAVHDVQSKETADLAGKRLFFDVAKRNEQKQNHINKKNLHTVEEGASEKPILYEDASGNVVVENVGSKNSQSLYRYSAKITSSDAIMVIVNDVPCAPVDRQVLAASTHGVTIDCKWPGSEFLELIIQKDEQTLSVVGVSSSVSRLLPGESL